MSVPQLAAELGVSQWTVERSLDQTAATLAPRAERLARQRRHATQQRLTARAAQLGFADPGAYLADRLLARGWPLAEVTAELGFQDLAGYLQRRQVEQGWSVRRMRAHLRVGRRWLVGELARLGLWR